MIMMIFDYRLTFHLQFTLHLGLPKVIDGFATVHASIKWAGLPNLQATHTLAAEHAVAWVINYGDLILHPDHFGLYKINIEHISKTLPPGISLWKGHMRPKGIS